MPLDFFSRDELLAIGDDPQLHLIEWSLRWRLQRLPHQKVPPGDLWTIWLLLAGRGAGKTRTSAETLGQWAATRPNTRWLVSAPTYGDLTGTCFEGESGLLNVVPRPLIQKYNSSEVELVLTNGSLIKGISAEKPERFRGGNYHGGWLDELAAWQYAQTAFDLLMFSMRLGAHPRLIISTTPKPREEIRTLLKREGADVVVTRASTYANIKNLAPTFRDQILQYEGTSLGRQEIHGEVLDPEEQGIIKRSWLKMWPARRELPAFDFIVVSLDTAFTEANRDKKTGDADPTACTVWGLFHDETDGDPGIMLLECWQEHLGFPDLLRRAPKEMEQRYGRLNNKPVLAPAYGPAYLDQDGRKPDVLLIEDKGSGISLRQMLAKEGIFAHAYNPGRANKLERLHAVSHVFAHGIVWIPEGRRTDKQTGKEIHTGKFASWTEDLISQLCAYSGEGTTKHDDLVDSTSQGIRLILDKNAIRIRPAPAPALLDEDYEPERRRNPYAG